MLLDILLTIYSVVRHITISCLTLSSFAGKWIIFLTYHLQNTVCILLVNIFRIITIALEDFNIFTIDLWNIISTVLFNIYSFVYILTDKVLYIVLNLTDVWYSFYTFVYKFLTTIYNGVVGIYTFIIQLCFYIKHYVLLFGSGVWFLFTLVPIGIVYFGVLFVYYMGKLLEEAYVSANNTLSGLKDIFFNVYEFVTDVPVESVLGLITSICLCYLLAPCVRESITVVYRNSRYLQLRIVNKLSYYKGLICTFYKDKFRTNVNYIATPAQNVIKEFNTCIACEDKEKCVLFLPCKHVCLCRDCYKRLPVHYGRTCPICRERIAKSIDIFL